MNELFLDNAEFTKTASAMTLDKDSTRWVKQIITHFLSQYPMFQTQPIVVEWKKIEAQKGYAVGVLKVGGNAALPLIVKAGQLFPIDIIMLNGNTLPLNSSTISELLSSKSPFADIAKVAPKTSLSIFGEGEGLQFSPTNNPGSQSTTSETRDAVKVGSVLDSISTVDPEDVIAILHRLKDDTLMSGFEDNGNLDLIEKLAEKAIESTKYTEIENYVKDLPVDRQYIYEDTNGNIFCKQANANIDHVWTTQITESDRDELNHLMAIEELEDDATSIKVAHLTAKTPEVGDKGFFMVDYTDKTATMEILAIDPVEDTFKYAAYSLPTGDTLVIDSDYNYLTYNKSLVKLADSQELLGTEPMPGDYGVFVVGTKCTKPFEVQHIEKVAEVGGYKIAGFTGLTLVDYFPMTYTGEEMHEYQGGTSLPGSARFIKLNTSLEKTAACVTKVEKDLKTQLKDKGKTKVKACTKTAEYTMYLVDSTTSGKIEPSLYEANTFFVPDNAVFEKEITITEYEKVAGSNNHYFGKDDAGLYFLTGSEFDKYAKENVIRDLSLTDATWALTHCGGTKEDIQKLAACKKNSKVAVKGKIKAPVTVKEITKKAEEMFASNLQVIKKIDLLKEAAVLSDKSTVDAVLSLGLMRKVNILEYLQALPTYEQVMGELAKLLLMVRLGLSQVPEEAIKTSMDAISAVIALLKEISAVMHLK